MKVVVTGAGGYMAVLVPMLLEKGHAVLALDRFFFGDTLAAHPKLETAGGTAVS